MKNQGRVTQHHMVRCKSHRTLSHGSSQAVFKLHATQHCFLHASRIIHQQHHLTVTDTTLKDQSVIAVVSTTKQEMIIHTRTIPATNATRLLISRSECRSVQHKQSHTPRKCVKYVTYHTESGIVNFVFCVHANTIGKPIIVRISVNGTD